MPQASDDLQAAMTRRFGNIGTAGPMCFLRDAGYTLSPSWEWSKPGVTDLKQMARDEFDCLLFLAHEWDFGGLQSEAGRAALERS